MARPGVKYAASLIRLPLVERNALERHFRPDQTHLMLDIDDIWLPAQGKIAPDQAIIGRLIAFVREWPQDTDILFHCWYGVSRSTAAAIIAMHVALEWTPARIVQTMRAALPFAAPNPLMLGLADQLLGLPGQLGGIAAQCGTARDFQGGHLTRLSFEPRDRALP
ncbi:MAG: hypothetical protein GY844_00625 [Bradyrhizobium sp.]|uniref:hypothetical protein n=1 Tax=unclassified Sphingomonas TaxID=196159 RepID=UPI0010F482CC|nr:MULTISPECIES: hypothetical protein [unclassified Sphingomonas]MCP4614913.1 hypothetical protein [Bradyrhizobium sp.]